MTDQQKRIVTDPTSEEVAANVRRVRVGKGLSTYQLSAALKEAGRPITPSAIAKIERGERRVDVGDLMALAVALGVNPSALLLPDTIDGDAPLTGGGTVPAVSAWDWADGKNALKTPEGDDGTAQLDFTRWARPRGRRRRYNLMTSAGREAALTDPHGKVDPGGSDG